MNKDYHIKPSKKDSEEDYVDKVDYIEITINFNEEDGYHLVDTRDDVEED